MRLPYWSLLSLLAVFPLFPSHSAPEPTPPVKAIHLTPNQTEQLKESNPLIHALVTEAAPTIGTPYAWGKSSLTKGIDCSNYTWQLYRKIGFPYKRYLGTQFMARIHQNGPFQKISFGEARPGDLLVYGYTQNKRWFGHVVILMDKDGSRTGIRGLTLGAHGGAINSVQYITFQGFGSGYFKHPRMKLVNVLRINASGRQ